MLLNTNNVGVKVRLRLCVTSPPTPHMYLLCSYLVLSKYITRHFVFLLFIYYLLTVVFIARTWLVIGECRK